MLLWIIVIVVSVLLDFVTKRLVAGGMELYESRVIIKNVLELEYVRNEGAAWGMLSNHRWVFMTITAIAIIVLPIILYKYRKLHFLFGFSLSLIIGGAIGNMIDRVFLGYVIDFIYLPFLDFIISPTSLLSIVGENTRISCPAMTQRFIRLISSSVLPQLIGPVINSNFPITCFFLLVCI